MTIPFLGRRRRAVRRGQPLRLALLALGEVARRTRTMLFLAFGEVARRTRTMLFLALGEVARRTLRFGSLAGGEVALWLLVVGHVVLLFLRNEMSPEPFRLTPPPRVTTATHLGTVPLAAGRACRGSMGAGMACSRSSSTGWPLGCGASPTACARSSSARYGER